MQPDDELLSGAPAQALAVVREPVLGGRREASGLLLDLRPQRRVREHLRKGNGGVALLLE